MTNTADRIATLKARISALEGVKPMSEAALFALGHGALDARLGGGIVRGRLHELFAAGPVDQACVTGFAVMLAMRLGGGPLLWLRQDDGVRRGGRLHAPGLAELGCDPSRIIEVQVPDEAALLQAAGDAVRCPHLAAVLIEPRAARTFDLTTSRRLSIAAEKTGVTLLLLHGAVEPHPSAAHSRWRIRAIPSAALMADAPGHSAIEISLIRHRGGLATFCQRLEWDRDQSAFRDTPIPGAVVSRPAGGSAATGDAEPAGCRNG